MSGIAGLVSLDDVALFLGVTKSHVIKWLYRISPSARYRVFTIQKRAGGERIIMSPAKPIAEMQKKLAVALKDHWSPHKCVHGYRDDRSIITNAEAHAGRKWLLNVDIEDFFGTITFPRVYGLLKSPSIGVGTKAAAVLAQLATNGGGLPQGAPSSPILANMVAHRLDKKLTQISRRLRCTYTRYADDLTFSSNRWPPPPDLVHEFSSSTVTLGAYLTRLLAKNGFRANPNKVWLSRPWQRMQVTGLIVNSRKVRVPRRFVHNLRAALHYTSTHGSSLAEARFLSDYANPSKAPYRPTSQLESALRGRLEFIRSVHQDGDPVYENLAHDYIAAFPNSPPPRTISTMKHFDAFICHSSADKPNIVRPLAAELKALGVSYWLDEEQIQPGSSIPLHVNDGLRRSQFLIPLVTRSFLSKNWTQTELGAILHREIESGTVQVVPVVVGNVASRFRRQFPLAGQKSYITWTDAATVASAIAQLKASPTAPTVP